jgi:hypothetical protein
VFSQKEKHAQKKKKKGQKGFSKHSFLSSLTHTHFYFLFSRDSSNRKTLCTSFKKKKKRKCAELCEKKKRKKRTVKSFACKKKKKKKARAQANWGNLRKVKKKKGKIRV